MKVQCQLLFSIHYFMPNQHVFLNQTYSWPFHYHTSLPVHPESIYPITSLTKFPTNPHLQSDHPVVNSRYLLHEAAQAHYYGLDPALALLSVTHTPAMAMGMDHRVGMLKPGTRSCSLCIL